MVHTPSSELINDRQNFGTKYCFALGNPNYDTKIPKKVCIKTNMHNLTSNCLPKKTPTQRYFPHELIICLSFPNWSLLSSCSCCSITSILRKDYPCVWLESRGSGAEPTLVLGTAPTLLMFGCKCWVGVAPTSFFVWLED
jgi:hypothetical protein